MQDFIATDKDFTVKDHDCTYVFVLDKTLSSRTCVSGS